MKKHKTGLITLLLAATLLTSACGTGAGQDHIEAPTHTGTVQTNTPTAPTMVGNRDTALRRVDYISLAASTESGFFSTAGEVIPELSAAEYEFIFYPTYGTRLYYNDLTTLQSTPLDIPGTERGLITEKGGNVYLFTTADKLIFIYENKVEAWALDLSESTTLTTTMQYFDSLYTDGSFLYYIDKGGSIGFESRLFKLDLSTGSSTKLLTLPEASTVLGAYDGRFLLRQGDAESTGQPKGFTYHSIDPATGDMEELWQLDGGGLDIYENYYLNGNIYWMLAGDYTTLYLHELESGETTPIFISETPYNHHPVVQQDDIVTLSSRHMDMSGYDYFALDLSSKEVTPHPFKPTEDRPFMEAIGRLGDQYVLYLGLQYPDIWRYDDSGQVVPANSEDVALFDPYNYTYIDEDWNRATARFASYFTQWAVIDPDDYWAGTPAYTPLVFTA